MSIELVAVVRRVFHESHRGSVVCLTSVDLIYPDGRDCGVPLFVEDYDGATKLQTKFGVTPQKLEAQRGRFERESEVCIELKADEAVVREMGFNPRELQPRKS